MQTKSHYDYLSEEENDFINQTQQLFEDIKAEFANDIKIMQTLKYDCQRIQISQDFLKGCIKLKEKIEYLEAYNPRSCFVNYTHFANYEFKTHEEMILVILCRIYDENKDYEKEGYKYKNQIINKILKKKNSKPKIGFNESIHKLYFFCQNQDNFKTIKKVNDKICKYSNNLDCFPNISQLYYINLNGKNKLERLDILRTESLKLFEMLKIRKEYRDFYLSHHHPVQNTSFLNDKDSIYLNLNFRGLLDKTIELIDLILGIVAFEDYSEYFIFPGVPQSMFEKLEEALILESGTKNVNLNRKN